MLVSMLVGFGGDFGGGCTNRAGAYPSWAGLVCLWVMVVLCVVVCCLCSTVAGDNSNVMTGSISIIIDE